jgi:hypothetical protein
MAKQAKITNAQILSAYRALNEMAPKISGVVTRFRITENVAALESHRNVWLNEFKKLVSEHAEKDADGQPVMTESGYKWTDGGAGATELDAIMVDASYSPISLFQLGKDVKAGAEIEYWQLHDISWLVDAAN